VIGDRAWLETWMALFGLFGGVETAYFASLEMNEAVKWLSEDTGA
jgi:hypothetical protein